LKIDRGIFEIRLIIADQLLFLIYFYMNNKTRIILLVPVDFFSLLLIHMWWARVRGSRGM